MRTTESFAARLMLALLSAGLLGACGAPRAARTVQPPGPAPVVGITATPFSLATPTAASTPAPRASPSPTRPGSTPGPPAERAGGASPAVVRTAGSGGGGDSRPAAIPGSQVSPTKPSPGSHNGPGATTAPLAGPPSPIASPTSGPPPPAGALATTIAFSTTSGPYAAGSQVHTSAGCPGAGVLVAGGYNLHTTSGAVPNNSLRALGSIPSTQDATAVTGGAAPDWTAVGGAGGQAMTDAVTDVYALCATGAALQPEVIVASVPGPAVAAGSVAATAVCPAGTVLLGGGASTEVSSSPSQPIQPSLHLIGSYPSDDAGRPATTGMEPSGWTAVGASGGAAIIGATTSAYALCTPAGPVLVQAVGASASGPQAASTPQPLTATCPSGTTVLGGGVDITLAGGTPQQGVHITGDYPSVGGAPVATGGTPTGWTAVTQSGGQPTPGTLSSAFALCGSRGP